MDKKIYTYQIVCYYPNIFSREFINIGILCGNDDNFKMLFLSENHIDMINCSFLSQKKKIIKELINKLKSDLNTIENINEVNNMSLYFNNFKFSNIELLVSKNDINTIIKDLFFQYIGYKFIKEEKKDRKIIIKEKIIKEIDLNFSKSFNYSYSDEHFDLVLKEKNHLKTFNTIIGSLFNEHDISRAMTAYLNSYNKNNNMIYSYFNSEKEILSKNKKAANVLTFLEEKFDMNSYSFNEEKINHSLEKLLNY